MSLGASLSGEGLSLSMGSRHILCGLDLVVRPGEILGLLGPNGAGKTTAIRALMGFVAPDRGDVKLAGRSILRMGVDARARLGIGYLPQDRSIFPDLTVSQNIAIVLEALGRPRDRIQEALERMQIGHLARQKAGSLSGGERRRLEMARLDALDPAIWLLDEPFTGMDPLSIERLSEMISGLRHGGKALLVSDHNVPQTLGLCDHVLIVDSGRVLVEGSPVKVASDPVARDRYLGGRFQAPIGS